MATQYANGRIVTDGLVLALDTADKNSYSGSGTTWTDMSGNNNNLSWTSPAATFTTYNNVPVISTVNTYTSLRAVRSTTYNSMRTLTGSYTACSFFRPNDISANKILVSFGPANNNCNGESVHPIAIGSGGKFAGGACGGLGTWGSTTGITPTTDRFYYICCTYDGSVETIYVDGVFDKSAALTTSTPVSSSNAISLGWIRDDGASFSMNASIGNITIYNRALSATEILQNYNAQKSRFNLI